MAQIEQIDKLLEDSQIRAGNAKRILRLTITEPAVRDQIIESLPEYPLPSDLNRVKRSVEAKIDEAQGLEREAYIQAYFKLHDILCELVPEWDRACRIAATQ